MKCFYQGVVRSDEDDKQFNGFVSFAIPELGINFRGQYKGYGEECEYASLLALLEFIELNNHLFRDRRIQIFGNNFSIISQVNSAAQPSGDLEPFCSLARSYKKKFPYILDWIPVDENLAQDGLI